VQDCGHVGNHLDTEEYRQNNDIDKLLVLKKKFGHESGI
jgi:hypothetical protein